MVSISVRHTRCTSPLAGEVDSFASAKLSGGGYPLAAHLKFFALGTPLPNPPSQGGRGHIECVGRLVNDLNDLASDVAQHVSLICSVTHVEPYIRWGGG